MDPLFIDLAVSQSCLGSLVCTRCLCLSQTRNRGQSPQNKECDARAEAHTAGEDRRISSYTSTAFPPSLSFFVHKGAGLAETSGGCGVGVRK